MLRLVDREPTAYNILLTGIFQGIGHDLSYSECSFTRNILEKYARLQVNQNRYKHLSVVLTKACFAYDTGEIMCSSKNARDHLPAMQQVSRSSWPSWVLDGGYVRFIPRDVRGSLEENPQRRPTSPGWAAVLSLDTWPRWTADSCWAFSWKV